jgi:hypothetical protein
MGMSPKLWGREGWRFIHFVAYTYPDRPKKKDRENYMQFLTSLQNVLPCEICAEHFRQNMKNMPPRMENRKEFFEWTVDMHNTVNKQNGKKEISYDAAYEQLGKINKQVSTDLLKGLALSSAIITIITLLSYRFTRK